MGGLAGADFYCDLSAENGGLSGSFRAWLSGSSQSPARSTFLRSRGPYVRLDGAVVANDWLDLVDGELQNPIDLTQSLQPSSSMVWTNTVSPGYPRSSAPDFGHCNEWTSLEPGDVGYIGQAGASDETWTTADPTSSCATPCALLHRAVASVWPVEAARLDAPTDSTGRSHSHPPVKPARRRPATTGGQRRMMFQSKPLR